MGRRRDVSEVSGSITPIPQAHGKQAVAWEPTQRKARLDQKWKREADSGSIDPIGRALPIGRKYAFIHTCVGMDATAAAIAALFAVAVTLSAEIEALNAFCCPAISTCIAPSASLKCPNARPCQRGNITASHTQPSIPPWAHGQHCHDTFPHPLGCMHERAPCT
jgi:hypothetical protein